MASSPAQRQPRRRKVDAGGSLSEITAGLMSANEAERMLDQALHLREGGALGGTERSGTVLGQVEDEAATIPSKTPPITLRTRPGNRNGARRDKRTMTGKIEYNDSGYPFISLPE